MPRGEAPAFPIPARAGAFSEPRWGVSDRRAGASNGRRRTDRRAKLGCQPTGRQTVEVRLQQGATARGKHNPRLFDKLIWSLPIPLFDPADGCHQQLVELAAQAEALAAETDVTGKHTFQAQRRLIREELEREGIAEAIDALVLRLLSAK